MNSAFASGAGWVAQYCSIPFSASLQRSSISFRVSGVTRGGYPSATASSRSIASCSVGVAADATGLMSPSVYPLLLEVKNKRIGPTVATQAMFSVGPYIIEHPNASRADQVLAGVEGALRAYENAVKVEEKTRDKFLYDLFAAKAAGKLR